MAYLIEETKGRFPTWLAPTQVKVLPVSEKTLDYARAVTEKLESAGIRVVLDESNEKIGYKIRVAQQEDRAPYMLVLEMCIRDRPDSQLHNAYSFQRILFQRNVYW